MRKTERKRQEGKSNLHRSNGPMVDCWHATHLFVLLLKLVGTCKTVGWIKGWMWEWPSSWLLRRTKEMYPACVFVSVCLNECVFVHLFVCVRERTNNHEWSCIMRDSAKGTAESLHMDLWQLTKGAETLGARMYLNKASKQQEKENGKQAATEDSEPMATNQNNSWPKTTRYLPHKLS